MTKWYVHSYENGSMVDGPGIRFVIFLSGCPLRCQYCHNPDTWDTTKSGKLTDSTEVIQKVKGALNFIKNGGGVTISGGEPLIKPEFVVEILKECKKMGLHTTLDTSGFLVKNLTKDILKNTDLFIVDLKCYNPKTYKKVTGVELQPTLEFIEILEKNNKPFWLRFVLVPGLTDNIKDIEKMADYISHLKNLERFEVLPFHKMGEFKWKELGYKYKLSKILPPSLDLLNKVLAVFKKKNIKVHC